jgi:hypothetical protein
MFSPKTTKNKHKRYKRKGWEGSMPESQPRQRPPVKSAYLLVIPVNETKIIIKKAETNHDLQKAQADRWATCISMHLLEEATLASWPTSVGMCSQNVRELTTH